MLRIAESLLNNCTEDVIHFENYSSFHSLRPVKAKEGGVSIYISILNQDKLIITECCLINENIEVWSVKVQRSKKATF